MFGSCWWCFASDIFLRLSARGGDAKVLALFSGDGVGVLQIDGAIDDSRVVLDRTPALSQRCHGSKRSSCASTRPAARWRRPRRSSRKFREQKEKARSSRRWAASPPPAAITSPRLRQDFANPGTMTGSIGVIMQLTNVEELMRKIGVKGRQCQKRRQQRHRFAVSTVVPRRARNPASRWSTTCIVNSSPRWPKGEAWTRRAYASSPTAGSIPARKRKELGLVDQLGTLEDAIDLAAKRPAWTASRRFTIPARNRNAGGTGYSWASSAVRLPGSERGWLRYEWSPSMLQ